jgi:hypothetical protein
VISNHLCTHLFQQRIPPSTIARSFDIELLLQTLTLNLKP